MIPNSSLDRITYILPVPERVEVVWREHSERAARQSFGCSHR